MKQTITYHVHNDIPESKFMEKTIDNVQIKNTNCWKKQEEEEVVVVVVEEEAEKKKKKKKKKERLNYSYFFFNTWTSEYKDLRKVAQIIFISSFITLCSSSHHQYTLVSVLC